MIFDTHAHYDDEAFDGDREELLSGLAAGGIGTVVNVGADMESTKTTIALTEKYPFIYGAAGVHPSSTAELDEEKFAELRVLAQSGKIVAIGEIGLDYYWEEPDHETQKKWFHRQLNLARELKLPVIIHSRDAAKDTLDIMKEEHSGEIGGVIHCFSYGKEMAAEYLKMGFYLGIGGVLTFKNAKKLLEVAEMAPLDRLVLETDCPYLAPVPNRGKRNSSLNLPYVAEKLAEIKKCTPEEIVRERIFGMDLGNPKNTIEVIQKYNFAFQKKFGQNFLIDTHVLDKIISAAGMTKEDTVLEVGPGIGTMTQRLSQAAGQVIAVEIDTNLIPILKDTLQDCENVTVINEDILKIDIKKMAEEKGGGRPVKVVANLPYYITTPIIMGLFESGAPIDNITVMVQKEVADRMQVGPGSKDYGALSLAVQYYAEPYIVANVPPNCFIPRPNVGSAVIRLTRHAKPPVEVKDKDLMFRLIRASFNQRRKTLQNGLSNAQDLSFSKEEIAAAIESLGLSPSVRGETLTLAQFAALSDVLGK